MIVLKILLTISIFLIGIYFLKLNKISQKDHGLNPYIGNEILVFESNWGNEDKMFLQESSKRINPTDHLALFPTRVEHLSILCKHTDPYSPGRYIKSEFVTLSAYDKNDVSLQVYFKAKESVFLWTVLA